MGEESKVRVKTRQSHHAVILASRQYPQGVLCDADEQYNTTDRIPLSLLMGEESKVRVTAASFPRYSPSFPRMRAVHRDENDKALAPFG